WNVLSSGAASASPTVGWGAQPHSGGGGRRAACRCVITSFRPVPEKTRDNAPFTDPRRPSRRRLGAGGPKRPGRRSSRAPPAPPAPSPAAPAGQDGARKGGTGTAEDESASWTRFNLREGLIGETEDKTFRYHVGGRFDWDSAWFRVPQNIQNSLNTPLED